MASMEAFDGEGACAWETLSAHGESVMDAACCDLLQQYRRTGGATREQDHSVGGQDTALGVYEQAQQLQARGGIQQGLERVPRALNVCLV